jgi:hypothetical protein
MDPTSVVQLAFELVKAIGVGNFIFVVSVLAIVINAPNIINQIVRKINDNKREKEIMQIVGKIDKGLDDIHSSNTEILKTETAAAKDLTSAISGLQSVDQSLNRSNSERRLENGLIAENLGKISFALSSIERMMRNVISEEDALRAASVTLGITASLKSDLLKRVLSTIEKLADTKTGHLTYDLTSDINSAWADFRNNLSNFNMPVRLKDLLDDYEKRFWEEDQMFKQILNIATSDIDLSLMKETISKTIDTGLRNLYSGLISFLEANNRVRK